MHYFITGASGWIGSAVTAELLAEGHQVTGLARSDDAAAAVASLGADVRRGSLEDLDALRAGADASDGVVHLGYVHDFSRIPEAAQTDQTAIETLGETLAGSDRPLVIASGVIGLASGRPGTERDQPAPGLHPRTGNADVALSFVERGVRSSVVRYAPTVHGAGDHGFVAVLVAIAREAGISGYIGDGTNKWPAVHRLDAARLTALTTLNAPAGTIVHAVAESGVPTRDIAEVIGRHLDIPVESIPSERADEHFGWMARFFALDAEVSSELTQQLLGWTPTGPTLVEDLETGSYFAGGSERG